MKFSIFLISTLIFNCYYVNTLPSHLKVTEWSKEFMWSKLNSAMILVESVHNLVQNPPHNMSDVKTMANDAMLDLTYASTEKLLGPLFPLFILLNLSLKLQIGRTYNALNYTDDFIQSLKYVTPEDIERDGIFGLYSKSLEYMRKKTLDPAMNVVQSNAVGPVESVLQSVKSKIPEFYQMNAEDYAYWKEFEALLTKDFKHWIAYRFLEQNDLAKIKSRDVKEKSKLLFKENLIEIIEYLKSRNRPEPPKYCKHCGHVVD